MLPQWLAKPDMIHRDIKSNIVPLTDVPEISTKLVKKLLCNGIQHLFPGNIIFAARLLFYLFIFTFWQVLTNLLN